MFYKKGSKYSNKKIEVDGIVFRSKAEGARYVDLKQLENAGVIYDLQLQPSFTLQENMKINENGKVKTQLKIKYIADFMYIEDNKIVVEDVKSPFVAKDKFYKLKKKLMIAKQEDLQFDIFREYLVFNKSRHEIHDSWRCF